MTSTDDRIITDRIRQNNYDMIADVQASRGLPVGHRNVAGPAVVDARTADRNGWSINQLSPYALTVTDTDGDTLTVEYSRGSNGVVSAVYAVDGDPRPITPRNGVTLRERVRIILAVG